MDFIKKNGSGILVCLAIAIPSWLLGKMFPVIGGAVIAIIAGMIVTMFWDNKGKAEPGIKWTSRVILQTAVVLLGFGMNLGVIFQTGKQSLPIIICTITTSLIIAWILQKALKVPAKPAIMNDLRYLVLLFFLHFYSLLILSPVDHHIIEAVLRLDGLCLESGA